MLDGIAAADEHLHVVNVRGKLRGAGSWNDEINGTSLGFEKVIAKFMTILDLLVAPKSVPALEFALEGVASG